MRFVSYELPRLCAPQRRARRPCDSSVTNYPAPARRRGAHDAHAAESPLKAPVRRLRTSRQRLAFLALPPVVRAAAARREALCKPDEFFTALAAARILPFQPSILAFPCSAAVSLTAQCLELRHRARPTLAPRPACCIKISPSPPPDSPSGALFSPAEPFFGVAAA